MPVKFPSILQLNNAEVEATLDANNLRGTTIQIDDFNSASLAKIGSGLVTAPGKRRLGTIVCTTGSALSPPRYYAYKQIINGDDVNISGSEWTTLTNWKEIPLNASPTAISGSWQGFISGSGIISGAQQLANTFLEAGSLTAEGISGSWGGYITGSGIVSSSNNLIIHSGSLQLLGTDSYLIITGSITSSGNISSSGFISASELYLTKNLYVSNSITSSGNIGTEASLFYSSSFNSDANFKVVTVDLNTGKLHHTASFGGSGGGGSVNLQSIETNVLPDLNNTRDLGGVSNKWKNLFAINTFFGGIHEINLETEGLDKMQEGTVLSLKNGILYPCEYEADPLVMGVVSKNENYPIVLGAEPILITGKIKEGDYIITSNIKGHGKGIDPQYIYSKQLFGKIIAQAIESGEGKSYTIKAMIRKM